jgi:hypothetical protein
MVIDDLFRDAEDANSRVEREKKWEWFGSVAMTRLEGASVVMVGTRWHQDDVIGRVIAQDEERIADGLEPEWEVINLAALAEENDPLGRPFGQELWPGSRYTPDYFTKLRRVIGEYLFAALYQGRPRPRGGAVFGEARYYTPATTSFNGCRTIIVCDPAASEKTSADYSAAIVLSVKGSGPDTVAYLRYVYRKQTSIPGLVQDLLSLQQRFGNAPRGRRSSRRVQGHPADAPVARPEAGLRDHAGGRQVHARPAGIGGVGGRTDLGARRQPPMARAVPGRDRRVHGGEGRARRPGRRAISRLEPGHREGAVSG